MAARKLQTEIDRTLKKVAEGVEVFESIYEKMQASTNQTQKEKLETDLKTQIKKLQRLRDQIKAWVASNDIKDKSVLLDNRRLIETQMEKFKACEKEMKTKAFSKEGLIQSAKLDPRQQEKLEVTTWLQSAVEQAEAEIESLQGVGGKKRGKGLQSSAGRLEDLEHLNERRKWHVNRLELILRLMDNGSLTTDRVQALREDVSYFVESNTDEDFNEYEGIYDELNLEVEEEKFGLANDEDDDSDESDAASDDLPPRTPNKRHEKDEESVASSKRDDSPVLKKPGVTLQMRKPSLATEVKPPPNPNFAQQPMASILRANLPPATPRPPALPPIRYACSSCRRLPSTPSTSQTIPPTSPMNLPEATGSTLSITPSASHSALHDSQFTTSPSLTHPSVTSPMLSSAASHQHDGSFYSGQDSPAISEAVPSSISGPAATSSPQRQQKEPAPSPPLPRAPSPAAPPPASVSTVPQFQLVTNGASQITQPLTQVPQSGSSPLPQQIQQVTPSTLPTPPASSMSVTQQAQQYPPGIKVPQSVEQQPTPIQAIPQPIGGSQRPPSTAPSQQPPHPPSRSAASGAFPGSLSDLVASFETVKQKAPHRMTNLGEVHKLLEGSYSNVPQPQDTEKPKYYVPRNPFNTPSFYPQAPHPILSTPGIFSQIDVETLFYVFYYLPGTYQQYMAAKELKRQSWRFHVKYMTWFQRHSEPQAITEEYEQGVYVYFDWEGSWCQRKKSDFRFEYRYLSED
ncbi:Not1 N-terminal domain, CCR4-Not complex component-domain-containing protein [Suillus paluster]|uniref:Not1 N-terminal domain, CCR4-Not complex component-domain-containing protein n=1 Tax=Suillus paluster TaxID=48578 RepID=UPI001B86E0D3|nr:Not1 N-terminal domain, CCR4-Not complex component-domain-containing protein [Suillus paluster]KAG1753723.1 Not1 N-terminal domain, CCR4-Not complex component-domain-containing protein [Suillus paluster]